MPPAPAAGEAFGRYRLIELIGRGGMAEVFRAVSQGLRGFERVFVIKRIRPDKSDSQKFVQMFCDEARISALLHHPNIVQVYDFGQIDGAYFMAMEYLDGRDLATVMRALRSEKAALPPALAALVAREVARALQHAHTAVLPDGAAGGIVHRDVTPSNIMLLRTGGVKILDFGIAKAAALARPDDDISGKSSGKTPRLQGKLAYLSPEQVRGTEVDGRSDLFSLGVVLWEMVAGHRLFAGENEFETMRNVLLQAIPEPSRRRSGIPAVLDAIVARALARDLDRRYPTAAAMADDLDRLLEELPPTSQAIPQLLERLFGGGREWDSARSDSRSSGDSDGVVKRPEGDEAVSATFSATGTAGSSADAANRSGGITAHDALPYGAGALAALGRPSRGLMVAWAAAVAGVVAAVVIAGWLAFSHRGRDATTTMSGEQDQSSSTRSVSTSR
jgi:serine/threonine protein kinase